MSVQRPAPESLKIIAHRLSQRSTSAPARGEMTTPGSTIKSEISANFVTEPVRSYVQTPSAKLVRPEPISDTSCPTQIRMNTRNPPVTVSPITSCSLNAVALYELTRQGRVLERTLAVYNIQPKTYGLLSCR